MEIDLYTGEEVIETWPLMYFAWRGCKYDGRCTITKNHICYDVNNVYGFSKVDRRTMLQLKFTIDKNRIKKVDVWRKLFRKRITITMQDGEKHMFSYRAINTGRIKDVLRCG